MAQDERLRGNQGCRRARGRTPILSRPASVGRSGPNLIRQRLDRREDHFLGMLEAGIFTVPSSPYRPLLDMAGCSLGDIRASVRTRGIEATLRRLRDEGVYVTFEEFKGRKPIVRRGKAVEAAPSDFFNPLRNTHYWVETGGTTGSAMRVSTDLNRVAVSASYLSIAHHAYGVDGAPKALWRGMLPASAGLNFLLACTHAGDLPERWFTPLRPEICSSRKYPLTTYAILALGRLNGVRLPWPEHVPLSEAHVVARWAPSGEAGGALLHQHIGQHGAARLPGRSRERHRPVRCDVFGRRRADDRGQSARHPERRRRVPAVLFHDRIGRIGHELCRSRRSQRPAFSRRFVGAHPAPASGARHGDGRRGVLRDFPSSFVPYVMLNVELDDYGILEERRCGCPFEELGLTQHVSRIRSFRKLTGEGVTLIGSDLEHILDTVLPDTFGGSALDYQLAEEEDDRGLTRLHLIVSPHVDIPDTQARSRPSARSARRAPAPITPAPAGKQPGHSG